MIWMTANSQSIFTDSLAKMWTQKYSWLGFHPQELETDFFRLIGAEKWSCYLCTYKARIFLPLRWTCQWLNSNIFRKYSVRFNRICALDINLAYKLLYINNYKTLWFLFYYYQVPTFGQRSMILRHTLLLCAEDTWTWLNFYWNAWGIPRKADSFFHTF